MNKERPKLRSYFVTGLLIWVPLAITFWVLSLIVGMMDQSLAWLPGRWQSEALLGMRVPGLGVLLTLAVIFVTGFLATNFVGARMVLAWEALLQRIPIVRTIYSSVKQVSDTLFSSSGQAFRKAVLVQYPRTGSWTIAFQTGTPVQEVLSKVSPHMISVYVPTTPNPTSGFFLMMPRTDVIELSMSVDEALKYVISMGVVGPGAAPDAPEAAKTQIKD
jgi:uncharacterized membrane protein